MMVRVAGMPGEGVTRGCVQLYVCARALIEA